MKNKITQTLVLTLAFTFLANLAWARPLCVPARENPAKQLAYALCEKINECHPENSVYQCVRGLYFEPQLGGDFLQNPDEREGDRLSLRQLSREYDTGNYCVNRIDLRGCLGFIDTLACQGEEVSVDTGYARARPADFSNVENLVEGACEGLFF